MVASLLWSKVNFGSVLGLKIWLLCWLSPAPASAQGPPEAEVNISDIVVQNGGSSGAAVSGSLHQGQPLVSRRGGGRRMAITAPGVTCYNRCSRCSTHISHSA